MVLLYKFTIAVPPFISTWLVKLPVDHHASDIAFAWMVLLYPGTCWRIPMIRSASRA